MKQINFIIFVLFLITSCTSSKQVVNDAKKHQTQQTQKAVAKKTILYDVDTLKNNSSTKVTNLDSIKTLEKNTLRANISDKKVKRVSHSLFNTLLANHVSTEGNVNYKGLKDNWNDLKNYITVLGDNLPTDSWSKQEKLAFWINAYNALTIDLILRHYPLQSIKDIKDPWKQRYWKLGSKWYNLDEIEHQILRKMNEPRIHFTIVCASFSCPKLQNKAFTASNLEAQLTNATKQFLEDTKRNNISESKIKLSKIFKWFAKDFKQNGSLIDFLNQYSEVKISKQAKKSYLDYNWGLNE